MSKWKVINKYCRLAKRFGLSDRDIRTVVLKDTNHILLKIKELENKHD